MRFHVTRPTLGQLLKWRIQLGRMQRCPYCERPVAREHGLEVDRAWKNHLDYCEDYQRVICDCIGCFPEDLAP